MPISEENPAVDVATADAIGFGADELVSCIDCGKSNAPNRQKCLYCGGTLPLTDANAEAGVSALRRLEAWEPSFNLVLGARERELSAPNIDAAAQILSIESTELAEMVNLGVPLPIARVEDEQTAEWVTTALDDLGIETQTILDKALDTEHPPVRVRALQFGNKGMIMTNFNSAMQHTASIDDVVLIVTGRIYESRREEVTRRKRGAMKVLDEFETSGDLGVIDLYLGTDAVGFRIQTNGFDFSVLGDEKEMLAGKNLVKLVELLKSICFNAMVATEYDDIRHHLDLVWEPETKKDLHGLQMRGYGKREFGATYISSNQTQFTKYSRMRRLMI